MNCSGIHAVALIAPAPDRKDRCQQLLLDVVTKVELNEPDTLQYQVFWLESSSEFLVLESYRNDDAFHKHVNRDYIKELQELAIREGLLAKPLDVKVSGELLGGFSRSV